MSYEEEMMMPEAAEAGSPADFINKILCGGTGLGNTVTLAFGLVLALNKKSAVVGYFVAGVSAAQLGAQFVWKQCGNVDFWSRS